MDPASDIYTMTLDGGRPCLDLVNTGYDDGQGQIMERMHNYRDLLTIASRCGLINRRMLKELNSEAVALPKRSAAVYQRALSIRRAMYETFSAMAHHRLSSLRGEWLQILNDAFRSVEESPGFQVRSNQLVPCEPAFPGRDLGYPLQQFIRSARELLTNEDQAMIKQCGGCDWLFLDGTKNHRRRWCDMQSCGSQAKSKRYYDRNKRSATATGMS